MPIFQKKAYIIHLFPDSDSQLLGSRRPIFLQKRQDIFMQELLQLIQQAGIAKIRANGLWHIVFEAGSKTEQLCLALLDGIVDSDEKASLLLYPGEKPGPKYNNVKERLKDRLLSAVFLMEQKGSDHSDRQRAYFECNRKWSAAMILMSRNAKLVSVDVLEALLRQTAHFEFTELSLSILSTLRLHFGTIDGNSAKYEMYRTQYRECQNVLLMENEAEDLYTHLVNQFLSVRSNKSLAATKAHEYYQQLQPYLLQSDAFRLHLCTRLIHSMSFDGPRRYEQIAFVCEDAIAFFRAKKYLSHLPLQAFYYQLTLCYIQMCSYDKGLATISEYSKFFEEGSFNWFKLQELVFLLHTHTGHYHESRVLTEQILDRIKGKNYPVFITEMWRIYYAYGFFLDIVQDKTQLQSANTPRFNMNKFLNDTPVFARDKRGMNIPILIIQFLNSLIEQNFHQSIDRIEAIEKYCSRYLKMDETFRSNCFIRMLLMIPSSFFHRETVQQRTEKLMHQLQSVPLQVANQSHEIEIVPYEILWNIVLNALPDKQFKIERKKIRKAA
jgi:hypothetical protein